jgi:hypothetical protein
MVAIKSLDENEIIAALLLSVNTLHGVVFNNSAYRLTLQKVLRRTSREGVGFLSKTLPRLGKCLDKALTGEHLMTRANHGFKTMDDSELPRFLGEFFKRVFAKDGVILPDPCITSIRILRDVLYLFYKYELPYSDEQEQNVLQKFERTEEEISSMSTVNAAEMPDYTVETTNVRRTGFKSTYSHREVVREARILLSRVFAAFDPMDIIPRHGPGAVATRQRQWEKFRWTNVSESITDVYPFDAYFCASLGHVCDTYQTYERIGNASLPARVILVSKDSRGPRLISCEPPDFQWIQQGLRQAIYRLVESHFLTRGNVFFTDQGPNQRGALLGSLYGGYATLDLNEASDRVSLDLVRLLFPPHIVRCLEAARSSSTELPDGRVLVLKKFAPMGSAICFPILALTIWAILTAAAPNADTCEGVLVYGDDVIVPTAFATNAIEQLESFGLKINRDKSCTKGFFRESCGMDAFKGNSVTPVRLRTVWSSLPSPGVYSSWIAYANSFYDRRYYALYDLIVENLHHIYGAIPSEDMHLQCPSLRYVVDDNRPRRSRINRALQKREFYVWDVKASVTNKEIGPWNQLLRYFTEGQVRKPDPDGRYRPNAPGAFSWDTGFSTSQYTSRRSSILYRRWR